MEFGEKLSKAVNKNNSLLCIGLDSDLSKLPEVVKHEAQPLFAFNKAIIDATADLVCAYKPNTAFYEALGADGIAQLKRTCDYVNTNYPDIPIILDAKRGDIGNTNNGYLDFAYNYLGADALTVHPYLGRESLAPLLDRGDKGLIVLCHTSNGGAGEFQELEVAGKPLYQEVASRVINDWNANGNCLLVIGATFPEQLRVLRGMSAKMTFLVPGIGAQGGDLKAVLGAGLTENNDGLIISSSRSIIFASPSDDFASAARREALTLNKTINELRHR